MHLILISGPEQGKSTQEKSHKFPENRLNGRVSLGHPAGVTARLPFSVSFSEANNRTSLGHRPVDPCLSCWCPRDTRPVSRGFLKFMCFFLFLKKKTRQVRDKCQEGTIFTDTIANSYLGILFGTRFCNGMGN